MNFDKIKEAVSGWIVEVLLSRIDVETVRGIFQRAVDALKEKTLETENQVDDWAVEALEAIVADDAKMEIVTQFIREKIGGVGVCESSISVDEYNALSLDIVGEKTADGECSDSVTSRLLAELLVMILPSLIEWFKK